MAEVSVLLNGEQAQSLRDYVYTIVSDTLETAKRDAGVSQRWLRKHQAANYAGVSDTTFSLWVSQGGLPCHLIKGIQLFSKDDINNFILNNGSMK